MILNGAKDYYQNDKARDKYRNLSEEGKNEKKRKKEEKKQKLKEYKEITIRFSLI